MTTPQTKADNRQEQREVQSLLVAHNILSVWHSHDAARSKLHEAIDLTTDPELASALWKRLNTPPCPAGDCRCLTCL